MELHENFSLFNGELLNGFLPLGESSLLEGLDHGLKSVVGVPSSDNHEGLVSDGRVGDQVLDMNVSWMDTRIDLVDFLMNGDILANEYNGSFVTDPKEISPQDLLSNLQSPAENVQEKSVTNESFASDDSGVELSLNESTSSLLELLPPQLIQNIEETSALSLLMDDIESPLVDCNVIENITTDLMSMSPDDVEKVLSTPSSPATPVSETTPTTDTSLSSTVDLADLFLNVPSPAPSINSVSSGYSDRSSPYARVEEDFKILPPVVKSSSGRSPAEKKRRKMQQNKDAAIRYRQKKKSETKLVDDECSVLEERNRHLQEQVDSMTREIAYLKELMADVTVAKESMKASKLK